MLAALTNMPCSLQGVLDIVGASPRRYFFQVLQHFATAPLERERLAYFATAAGRDDLYRWVNKLICADGGVVSSGSTLPDPEC